jgi:hypothetical protein
MKNISLNKAYFSAFALMFSLSAHSGGGGGSSTDGLPLPDSCTSNCGYETGPNPTLSFV